MVAALANGFDAAVADTPLELPPTFRYTSDCRCGRALALLQPITLDQIIEIDALGAYPTDDYPVDLVLA
jgi:hypothetical protein